MVACCSVRLVVVSLPVGDARAVKGRGPIHAPGNGWFLVPAPGLNKKDVERWRKAIGGVHHGHLLVWKSAPDADGRTCWLRCVPRGGRWVLVYSQRPPAAGERLVKR